MNEADSNNEPSDATGGAAGEALQDEGCPLRVALEDGTSLASSKARAAPNDDPLTGRQTSGAPPKQPHAPPEPHEVAPLQQGRDVATQGGVVAGLTLCSRISGLLRDIVLSHFLGAGAAADVFFLALRIPNFFRRIFAEGAFAQAFVPVLAGYRERRERGEPGADRALRDFVAAVGGNLGTALVVVVALGVLGAWAFVAAFMPGYLADADRMSLAVDLTRIMFPYVAFISMVAFAGVLLNSAHRYAVPAFTPVLLNICLIAAALLAGSQASMTLAGTAYALAWGVLVAGVAQCVFQLPSLVRTGMLVWPRPNWRDPGVRRVGALLLPAVLAGSAGQINVLVSTVLASMLVSGSVSWLFYADRLMELPIGIVAVALGTVLITNLSRVHRQGDVGQFSELLDWGMRLGVLLGLPAAVALVVLGYPLVTTIFQHGEFTADDAARTSTALAAYSVGLLPLVLVKIAQPAYFAREDTKTPLRCTVVSVVVNVCLSVATFRALGFLGLALANSAAAFVNAGMLLFGLHREEVWQLSGRLRRTVLITVLATLGMVGALLALAPGREAWLAASAIERSVWLSGLVAAGLAVFVTGALACGIRPRDLRHWT